MLLRQRQVSSTPEKSVLPAPTYWIARMGWWPAPATWFDVRQEHGRAARESGDVGGPGHGGQVVPDPLVLRGVGRQAREEVRGAFLGQLQLHGALAGGGRAREQHGQDVLERRADQVAVVLPPAGDQRQRAAADADHVGQFLEEGVGQQVARHVAQEDQVVVGEVLLVGRQLAR